MRLRLTATVLLVAGGVVLPACESDDGETGASGTTGVVESAPFSFGSAQVVATPGAVRVVVTDRGLGPTIFALNRHEVHFRFLDPNGQGGVETRWLAGLQEHNDATLSDLDGNGLDDFVVCAAHTNLCSAALLDPDSVRVIASATLGRAVGMRPHGALPAYIIADDRGSWGWWLLPADGSEFWSEAGSLALDVDTSVMVGDFVGNGGQQIAALSDTSLQIHEPVSDGSDFVLLASAAVSAQGEFLGSGDLDGDGAKEIVLDELSGGLLVAHLRTDAAIDIAPGPAVPTVVTSVTVADLDGDGSAELVAGSADEDLGDQLRIWSSPALDGPAPTIHDLAFTPRSIAAIDLDSDADLDLIVSSYDDIYAVLNEG